jgi:cardiolipin synthase
MTDIQLVASGEKWTGYGIRSFSSAVENLLDSSIDELVMTVWIITDSMITENLIRALDRGVSVNVFINDSPDQKTEMREKVIRLGEEYGHLGVHLIKDERLHAKVLVADTRWVLVGSANVTFTGMVKNYEMGVMFEDGDIAGEIVRLLWRLKPK